MSEVQFKLPDLGEGLEDAEIVRWLVAEGDQINLNDPLVEVDTAKALVEIPSPSAGRIGKLHAAAGDVVKVGAALVTFEVEGGAEAEPSGRKAVLVGYGVDGETKSPRRRRLKAGRAVEEPARSPEAPLDGDTEVSRTVLAAPPVRRLAAERGVDIGKIRGSGPGGRVTRDDVMAATSGASTEERIPVRGVRRIVAQRMTSSARNIPHVTTFLTVDASNVESARQSTDAETKVTALAVIARAFLEVCKAHSKLNSSWDERAGEIVLFRRYHLGVATDTERGLMVPVVRDADQMAVGEIAEEIARLSALARDGRAAPEELTGSTVTISNVGTFGAEFGTPIINEPESAILAVGAIAERPWAEGGELTVRPTVTLSLSFDHRVMDGAEAGRALLDLKRLLEDRVALGELR